VERRLPPFGKGGIEGGFFVGARGDAPDAGRVSDPARRKVQLVGIQRGLRIMRVLLLALLVLVAMCGCSRHREHAAQLRNEGVSAQSFADSQAAYYADAAQAVLAGRFADKWVPVPQHPGGIDTFYVGYPDSADPPRAFLERKGDARHIFLPYSQRRIQGSGDNWRIGVRQVVSADTVEMWYEQDVPASEYPIIGPIRADVRLSRNQGTWKVTGWHWWPRM
jgi:hypothetical protein